MTLQPRYNLWLELNGEVVLSLWRVELLRAIAATGSISGAAGRDEKQPSAFSDGCFFTDTYRRLSGYSYG